MINYHETAGRKDGGQGQDNCTYSSDPEKNKKILGKDFTDLTKPALSGVLLATMKFIDLLYTEKSSAKKAEELERKLHRLIQ